MQVISLNPGEPRAPRGEHRLSPRPCGVTEPPTDGDSTVSARARSRTTLHRVVHVAMSWRPTVGPEVEPASSPHLQGGGRQPLLRFCKAKAVGYGHLGASVNSHLLFRDPPPRPSPFPCRPLQGEGARRVRSAIVHLTFERRRRLEMAGLTRTFGIRQCKISPPIRRCRCQGAGRSRRQNGATGKLALGVGPHPAQHRPQLPDHQNP